ncbi:MAG: hypothetical protein LH609_12545 [Rudanella sp.]|nr:hypothetical protein [Rudanella sp.]
MKPEMHRNHKAKTAWERAEFKAEREAKMAAMTPAEREAFNANHQGKGQKRIANMTPQQLLRKNRIDSQALSIVGTGVETTFLANLSPTDLTRLQQNPSVLSVMYPRPAKKIKTASA